MKRYNPRHMPPLRDLFYRRVERGVHEKGGKIYTRYVKVPLVRSRHFRVIAWLVAVSVATFLLQLVIRHYAEKAPAPSAETAGSQYQP